LTLTANNGITPNATQSFTLTVNQAPAITSANAATFIVGSAGSFTITSTGYPHATLSEAGTLPSGVTFVNNADGTATLSGTPAAGSGNTYSLTLTANNGITPNATQDFTLTVNQAPAITSADDTTFIVGSAGSFTITSTGYPSATLSETGTLPSGVTFLVNGNGTATLSGTPQAGSVGDFTLMIAAGNSIPPTASQEFDLTVAAANTLTTSSASPATSVYGQLVVVDARVSGNVTGNAPSGTVTFQEGNTVLDIATLDPSGNATFSTTDLAVGSHTITATYSGDSNFNSSAAASLVQTVNPAPSIITAQSSSSATTVGQPITLVATITVPSGTGPATGTVTFLDGDNVLGTAPLITAGPTTSVMNGITALVSAPVAANGQATLTVPSLSAGTHAITAEYSGDATHAPSTTAVANIVIVAPNPDNQPGPTVAALARYGYHAQPTFLVVFFNGLLDPITAQTASNYKVVGPINQPGPHKPIIVSSAVYNPGTSTVTLAFNHRMNVHFRYRLTINGTAPLGITSPSNVPLNAASGGDPGSNYVATFGPGILAGRASQRTSLGHTWFRFFGKALSGGAVDHLLATEKFPIERRRSKP
jgi:hypothetical protein